MATSARRLATLACVLAGLALATPAPAQDTTDWVTNLPRAPIHVKSWPDGRKVAICVVLYVEVWGYGQGPNLRSDLNGRDPDVVDEAFRQYGIDWGIPRVGRIFRDENVPLSIALNAQFPAAHADIWRQFRALVPTAPILGHGINNSNQLLPLGRGLALQTDYVRRTLETIEHDTGQRPIGWSSPSVYPNGDTYAATAAAGIRYSLDGMDSDTLSRLATPSGPLLLIPYPPTTVDLGQYLTRGKEPMDMERLWTDYVGELVDEAEADPGREATVVAIGIHPFVMGTPAGAAALRRTLQALKQQRLVWLTDTEAVFKAAGETR